MSKHLSRRELLRGKEQEAKPVKNAVITPGSPMHRRQQMRGLAAAAVPVEEPAASVTVEPVVVAPVLEPVTAVTKPVAKKRVAKKKVVATKKAAVKKPAGSKKPVKKAK